MADNTRDGDGDAVIIPFPVERVSPPVESVKQDVATPPGDRPQEPASVDDLRGRIRSIEAGEVSLSMGADPEKAPQKDERRAKNIALHQLAVSGRSEAEVRERLAARDIAPDIIEQEVGRLKGVGLVDDLALAQNLVEQLRVKKKLGDRAIYQALRRRKIATDVIDSALMEGSVDEDVAVFEVATERARSLSHLDYDVAYRRLVGFIQRRGYSGSHVFEAARRALDDASGISRTPTGFGN
jgi:regulatory protein